MSDEVNKQLTKSATSKNDNSIPEASYIPDVAKFLNQFGKDIAMSALKELLAKFNYMSESLTFQKRSLLRKIPDIQQSLETVLFIKRKNEEGEKYSTHFPLTDNCHAKAELEPTSTVCLWLGANVMMEYSIEEAEKLLTTSQENAKTSLKSLDTSLSFLREQITTTEVNIARCHNYTVRQKQKTQEAAA